MVIALDKHKKPIGFITEKRARQLQERKRACVYRYYPMVVILKDVDYRGCRNLLSYRLKIDPGAKHTGIAIVCNETNEVMLYMQIEHRAELIVDNLSKRKGYRRNRRNRKTKYRRCKYKNGEHDSAREDGWLPPSIRSIGDNIIKMTRKLMRYINITECSFEAVRFDTQLMDNHDIEGIEYQQGTLFGYELREYLLEKYRHTCQYCGGESGDSVLEWEHIIPKSRGGSDSVKNATLACQSCNQEKNNRTPAEWLEDLKTHKKHTKVEEKRIELLERFAEGKPKMQGSNRYSAWANSSRRYMEKGLFDIFYNVECSSGGKTKYNRVTLGLPKDHHYDALCVGNIPDGGYIDRTNGYVTYAVAKGRGMRRRGLVNSCGIITTKFTDRSKRKFGFQSGDIVSVNNPKGKYAGQYVGRVSVRSSGLFAIKCLDGSKKTVNYKYCRLLQNTDGYLWGTRCAIPLGHK